MEAVVKPKTAYVSERLVAASGAFLLHGLIAAVIVASVSQKIIPPEAAGGFEVVDLSSYGAAPSEQKKEAPLPPEPEKPTEEETVKPQKVEQEPMVEPAPEPVVEPEPAIEPLVKTNPDPIKPVALKNKAVHKARPKPKPVPPTKKEIKKSSPAKKQVAKKRPTTVPAKQNKITSASSGEAAFVPPNGKTAYLSNPKPTYPKMARRRGLEGVVILAVAISSQGKVKALTLKKSSGHKLLDRAAHNAVKRWHFTPATRGGIKVEASVDVPIRFTLNHFKKGSS